MIRNVHAVKVDAELQQLRLRLYSHAAPQLRASSAPVLCDRRHRCCVVSARRSKASMPSSITPTKTALITGITDQDGSYLAELLLEKGYEVHWIKRRASSFNTPRIDHLYQDPHEDDPRLLLQYGDLTDSSNLIRIIQQVQPDEIYNLGSPKPCGGEFLGGIPSQGQGP